VGEQGLVRYDGAGWQYYARGRELPDAPVNDILVATDGTLWVGVEGYGLLHHNLQGWRFINSLHGLASNSVTRLYEAPDGALWFATRHGLSRYTPAP
jgi:ligand-binding sensor domain-containing protein